MKEVYSYAEGHWKIPGEIYTHNGALRNRNKFRGSGSLGTRRSSMSESKINI
jgi:hypothetical protein